MIIKANNIIDLLKERQDFSQKMQNNTLVSKETRFYFLKLYVKCSEAIFLYDSYKTHARKSGALKKMKEFQNKAIEILNDLRDIIVNSEMYYFESMDIHIKTEEKPRQTMRMQRNNQKSIRKIHKIYDEVIHLK